MATRWQVEFDRYFVRQVRFRTSIPDLDVYSAFQLFEDSKIKDSFWMEMGAELNVSHRKLHDYYHNTWSKRFYTDITPYKQLLVQLSESNSIINMPVKNQLTFIFDHLKQLFPNQKFHYNSVYQFVSYRKRAPKTVQKGPEIHLNVFDFADNTLFESTNTDHNKTE
ncbi:Conserved_hypothetical protein [Hexamita inflata]|uniref:Uncharacterized protein n=1 Tax=Hexamita inflata TaxID=28002 RepID=A0AA86PD92_9EUKA|nr:Conserved hypothetical protein [Hexamita inflata]